MCGLAGAVIFRNPAVVESLDENWKTCSVHDELYPVGPFLVLVSMLFLNHTHETMVFTGDVKGTRIKTGMFCGKLGHRHGRCFCRTPPQNFDRGHMKGFRQRMIDDGQHLKLKEKKRMRGMCFNSKQQWCEYSTIQHRSVPDCMVMKEAEGSNVGVRFLLKPYLLLVRSCKNN